jgi:hypothetical protein
MRNVINCHLNHVKIVLPYVIGNVLTVFVKNPKTLSSGEKVRFFLDSGNIY